MKRKVAAAHLATVLLIASLPSCQTKQSSGEPKTPVTQPKKLSVRMPLAEYIPAPGLRWLVQIRPRALVKDDSIRKDWEPVFTSQRIDAFRAASGFDPAQVEELWIAGYDFGTLYLFDATLVGKSAESSFRNRSLTTAEVSTQKDDLVHLTGMMNQVPHAFVHLDQYMIGIVEGDVSLAKIVAAYAEGRLSKTASALQTRYAKPLAEFSQEAKVRAFALGPFPEATDPIVAGLVSGAIGVEFKGDALHLAAKSLGLWSSDHKQLALHLSAWIHDVLSTPELRAFGWGSPLELSPVKCDAAPSEPDMNACVMEGSWNSAQLARATHRITASDMSELVEGTASPDSTETTNGQTGNQSAPSPPGEVR